MTPTVIEIEIEIEFFYNMYPTVNITVSNGASHLIFSRTTSL
jgi:hypothetical protein